MSRLLEGKKAIVTGASSGIGKGIARVFAREGADLVFTYRSNKNGADDVCAELSEYGVKVKAIQADVSEVSDCFWNSGSNGYILPRGKYYYELCFFAI